MSSMQETTSFRTKTPLKTWGGRLAGMLFGLLLAWILLEVLLRLFFFSLTPRQQLILRNVHITPFTDRKLLPDPIWQPDRDYLTINRPVTNLQQSGSAEVRFTVTTETLWKLRVAFRTRQELVDRHVDGVAVGDSFTFCFTDEKDCWVQRLGQLTDRNLINMGITSTGSVSHLRILQDFGMPLQPPLVIWQWFGNDANEDFGLAELRGETDVRSPNPPLPVPRLTWWDKNSAVYAMLKLYLGSENRYEASLQFLDPAHAEEGEVSLSFGQPYLWDAFDITQPQNQYGWARSQQAFLEAREMVEEYGGTLLFVLLPTKEQVYHEMSEPLLGAEKIDLLQASYDMMADFCESQGLTCLDMLPILRAHTDEQLYYTTDMHLNPRGNALLAATLAEWLDQHPGVFETP